MNIYIGLPAYNEEASIKPLFSRISQLKETVSNKIVIIIYDDGCTDNTKNEVFLWKNSLEIIYLDGVINKGLGAGMNALLTDFEQRAGNDDVLVIMDCDDTQNPAQIPQMIEVLQEHPKTDVVIASRYRAGSTISGVPPHRVLLSICAAVLYKMIHPIFHVRDYTCGYRAYRYSIISMIFSKFGTPLLKENGFACMVELLLKLARADGKFREVPLTLAYDNKMSASKMDVSGNAFRLLKKLIAWRLEGFK